MKSGMKDECKRLCDIRSLRQLRSVQRENEAAKKAAKSRMRGELFKILSFERIFSIENLIKTVKNWF